MTKQLDFFFFLGSTYTYLSVNRAAELAQREGVALNWRPFSVRALMREQNNSPFAGKPLKMKYMWRDIERRAEVLGIPFGGIVKYPIDADELANHVSTLAAMEGWCAEFTRAAYAAWFLENKDPGNIDTLSALLAKVGKDARAIIARASEEDVRERYAAETSTARDLGIFGSPTFACGSEIFWGDDRLEDAIAWCKAN